MSIHKELAEVQKKLNAPKTQINKFGGYNYRSCEDILEEIKHITECSVTLCDDLVIIGERYYVKATACLVNLEGESVCTASFARESDARAGMCSEQNTGSCSSYARKYALNGLFAIDDSKDPDSHEPQNKPPYTQEMFDKNKEAWASAIEKGTTNGGIINMIKSKYSLTKEQEMEILAIKV